MYVKIIISFILTIYVRVYTYLHNINRRQKTEQKNGTTYIFPHFLLFKLNFRLLLHHFHHCIFLKGGLYVRFIFKVEQVCTINHFIYPFQSCKTTR